MPFVHAAPRLRYPTALAIGAAGLVVRWLLDPILGDVQPYFGVLVGTSLATLWCGFGPGLAALAFTFVASEWLFSDVDVLTHPVHLLASLITFAFGAVVVWLMAGQRTARDDARRDAAAADHRRAELQREVERRQALEAELRHSREEFRTLVERAPVGILGADAKGRCTFANRMWYDLTGLTPADTLGNAWSRAIHPDDLAATMDRWTESVATRYPYINELRVVHVDGTVHPVLATAQPIYDAGGAVVSFIGTVMDLTELHHREAMLRRLIDTQEQEKQSLCHEFHDGLIQYAVGSRMLLESYLRNHPGAPQRDVIETVISHLGRGIDDGRLLIRGIRTAVLDDLGLAAALHDLADQSASAGITVAVDLPADLDTLPPVLETTVYRVVQEALANVRRHANVTTARVVLTRHPDRLDLEVSDQGCGFDPAAAKVRGFGLAGMIERTRLAGGTCTVDSAPGRGTRIAIRLPFPAAAATLPAPR